MEKAIIQRQLDLSYNYTYISKTYIPLIDGTGTTCANCNRLISNIATVKRSDSKIYYIGLDCLETLMLNNEILKGVSIDFAEIKKQLPKVKRGIKGVKEFISINEGINNVNIEYSNSFRDWVEFYYYIGSKCVYNESYKLKNIDIDYLEKSLSKSFQNIKFNLILK